MKRLSRLSLAWQALRELGFYQPMLYAVYRLGLSSGHYRHQLALARKQPDPPISAFTVATIFLVPERTALLGTLGEAGVERCLAEADEILAGRVRLFGGEPVDLQLTPNGPLVDWTAYESGKAVYRGPDHSNRQPGQSAETWDDIKFIWEPARFGWAYSLGRAYILSGDERYPAGFWRYADEFLQANPPYQGPHWISAQEAGLRLVAFAFALQVFGGSAHTTPERSQSLARAIAAHAGRIPATLVYGRAQNNNHLLSEAAGLYTAGLILPRHPQANQWRALGWRWFNTGLQTQIDPDGTYSQHSANYQRLVLQIGLWINLLANHLGQPLPVLSRERLASAARWLLALADPSSGRLPNLGPNDGALIQPLSGCTFTDYRPTLQAAGLAFLGQSAFGPGEWDETSHWLGLLPSTDQEKPAVGPGSPDLASHAAPPHVLQSPDQQGWAYLRIARFHSRPGHADQLHLDLWWRGLNIAQDAGSYRYNAPPPWDNALAHTQVHNTLSVNHAEQMRRAGRFLYLDWAQARLEAGEQNINGTWRKLSAWHDGYRSLGLRHRRSVTVLSSTEWLVEDALLPITRRAARSQAGCLVGLHWLLPDWPWELHGPALHLKSPYGWVRLVIAPGAAIVPGSLDICLDRAGQRLAGEGSAPPTWGWVSQTYAEKQPALAFSMHARTVAGVAFTSRWYFPAADSIVPEGGEP